MRGRGNDGVGMGKQFVDTGVCAWYYPNCQRVWYRGSVMGMVARLFGVGWFVAVCIVCGVWGGAWLDGRLGTSPLCLLVGLAVGVAAAGVGVYRMLIAVVSAGSE